MEEGELLSLLSQMMNDCVLLNHIRVNDPFGGYKETWEEGATFQAAISKDGSIEAQIAERQELGEIYTVVTPRSFALNYHDVFRRISDGVLFRVTSNSQEAHPASTVQINRVSAERWELPA